MILRTRPGLQQRRQAVVGIAGVVVDDDEVLRALRDQAVDQLGRLPAPPKPPIMMVDPSAMPASAASTLGKILLITCCSFRS
jgi:hypothetical protein